MNFFSLSCLKKKKRKLIARDFSQFQYSRSFRIDFILKKKNIPSLDFILKNHGLYSTFFFFEILYFRLFQAVKYVDDKLDPKLSSHSERREFCLIDSSFEPGKVKDSCKRFVKVFVAGWKSFFKKSQTEKKYGRVFRKAKGRKKERERGKKKKQSLEYSQDTCTLACVLRIILFWQSIKAQTAGIQLHLSSEFHCFSFYYISSSD